MKNGSYQHHIIWKKEVWPKLPLIVTSRHSMPPVVTRCHSLYHLLSFVVTRCHLLYHSLSLFVPLAVTRCTTRYYSLSLFVTLVVPLFIPLVVPLVVTRCHTRCTTRFHSLSLVVSLVVTRCTARLSFYKQSLFSYEYCKIFKSNYFEEHLQTAASEAIINKKWN